ncbi:MAG: CPBP family intramembrane metalloprotease [Capnocytophaga sp.]|nr:CPBP family intramembrane metalloprotease [Capnocytophaga sp.]
MYIENAYLGKNPKWLYIFYPLAFFGLMAINLLASLVLDVNILMKNVIEEKGELRYFAEDMMIPFAVFCVSLLAWVRYVHGQPLKAFHTTRTKIDWKRFFFAFFLWGSVTTTVIVVDFWLSPESYIWNFQADKFFILLILTILLIPFQAGFEEYFFRGYLMQCLGIWVKNRWFPLIFTSLTFGLVHIANPEVSKLGYGAIFYYIGTGLFLGIITLMDEGLELALGFHIANNMITALLITSDWSVMQLPSMFKDISEPSFGLEILLPILVYLPILLYIFAKKYRWTNWKEKLLGRVLTEKEFLELKQ